MTKNILLIIVFYMIAVNALSAQSTDINIGIKGGIDYFKYPVAPFSEITYQQKGGFFIGAYGVIYLADKLTLQPEILLRRHRRNEFFSDIVFRLSGGTPASIGFKLELQVTDLILQIPVAAQYHFTDQVFFELGPQFSQIIIRKLDIAEESFDSNNAPIYDGAEVISDNEYDNFDFGFLIGIGYNFNESIGLFTRYNLSITEKDNQIKSSIIDLGLKLNFR